MIFLIEYIRKRGELKTFNTFDDSEMAKASDERLKLELLRRESEIVILQAKSLDHIKRTHGRYFSGKNSFNHNR